MGRPHETRASHKFSFGEVLEGGHVGASVGEWGQVGGWAGGWMEWVCGCVDGCSLAKIGATQGITSPPQEYVG